MNSGINSKTEKIFQFFWTAFFILITVIAMVPILRVISVSFRCDYGGQGVCIPGGL